MSNIITAYDEIYRIDGQPLSQQDRWRIYRGLIRAHDRFGSYWVRIHAEYDPHKRRVRLQSGAGKIRLCRDDFPEQPWFESQFILWTRWADGGSSGDSLSITGNEATVQLCCLWDTTLTSSVPGSVSQTALYGFDAVLLGGPLRVLGSLAQPLGDDQRHLLEVSGTYEVLADRGFVDLTERFTGPALSYEAGYRPKRFFAEAYGPQKVGWHSSISALPETMMDFFVLEPELKFVALCWQGRAVHVQDRRGYIGSSSDPGEWRGRKPLPSGLCAAGWDNLINPAYLAFCAWQAEQVRWADE